MALQHRLVRARPDRVWAVLENAGCYERWVVGTHLSRPADDRWPEEGSVLRYQVKAGPFRYEGETVVRVHEPPDRLELEARAGDHASARIAIEVRPWGDETLVVLDEHPLRGRGWTFHHAAIDAVAQWRHRAMLARLARVCEDGRRERP
ncbi:SRPBCC family protein [Streptomyces sp. WAC07061]|uniref:SRPBCC domain-containing protein n=1 Tax=Streptomyces sp. WAC07061 TaxID=2487410 RepID=UPI000F76E51B|nr:SRPBCC domain-containing protein [Streptomyces sp. WAC07061]RSS48811.1 SRPBCC family protein [Streptomyces sp. WAC07061]